MRDDTRFLKYTAEKSEINLKLTCSPQNTILKVLSLNLKKYSREKKIPKLMFALLSLGGIPYNGKIFGSDFVPGEPVTRTAMCLISN